MFNVGEMVKIILPNDHKFLEVGEIIYNEFGWIGVVFPNDINEYEYSQNQLELQVKRVVKAISGPKLWKK